VGPATCNDPTHADWLRRIQHLAEQYEALKQEFAAARERHAAEVAVLRAEIADLKSKVGRNSSNSSRPPSQDGLSEKQRRRAERKSSRESSGRKQGAQPGHPGSGRGLVDESEVDFLEVHYPPTCGGCGHGLPEVPDGAPRREQKWEIPPVEPVITEHRFHTVTCPHCGEKTTAAPGPEVPQGAFGPRLEATTAYLRGSAHLSFLEIRRVFADLFGLAISTGALARISDRVSLRLAPIYDEALGAARLAPVVHADESPWYLRGVLCWLWLLATDQLKVFRVDEERSKAAAKRLLGEVLLGILVSDRYVVYRDQPAERHQFCIPHLIRDAKALIALGGDAKAFGEELLAQLKTASKEHRLFREEHHDRDLLRERLAPTIEAMVGLLVSGADGEHVRVANFSGHLLMKAESIWTFVDQDCPTSNNMGERAMRRPVTWRKICLGSQSTTGFRFVERILTTVESLRAQGRNILDFLVETMNAAAQGRAPPSLVPVPSTS
jgi:transposase